MTSSPLAVASVPPHGGRDSGRDKIVFFFFSFLSFFFPRCSFFFSLCFSFRFLFVLVFPLFFDPNPSPEEHFTCPFSVLSSVHILFVSQSCTACVFLVFRQSTVDSARTIHACLIHSCIQTFDLFSFRDCQEKDKRIMVAEQC